MWTAPAFLDEFCERLRARPAVEGVKVHTAPVDSVSAGEYIVFTRVVGEQVWAALGAGRKEDSYTAQGVVSVVKTVAGEEGAVEVRNRAKALLLEVAAQVMDLARDQSTFKNDIGADAMTELNLANVSINFQGVASDNARQCDVTFDIQVTARISTS